MPTKLEMQETIRKLQERAESAERYKADVHRLQRENAALRNDLKSKPKAAPVRPVAAPEPTIVRRPDPAATARIAELEAQVSLLKRELEAR